MSARSNVWAGRAVTNARSIVATWLPAPCGQCGKQVTLRDRWVVGHTIARSLRPDLMWEVSNWRPEHRACSDASAQSAVIAKAKSEALAEHGIFPTGTGAGESPLLPVSPSVAPETPYEVRECLKWTNPSLAQATWLSGLLEVPEDASVPLAMTPPHADAVGSYGQEASDFIEAAFKVKLRWWQTLVLVRMLEHREDGSLCWREVLMSASRRSGKSLLLRGLAIWRMSNPQLFQGEVQTVMHVASDVAIAREVQRFAWHWADDAGWKISKANGKEQIETPEGDRWLVRAQNATVGYDGTLILGDEVWNIPPTIVDDNLEPAMLDRVWPQMLLTSTAHPQARSTMPGRIATALAADDDSTLLLLWAAPWGCDVGDPVMWRAASPHWSADRRKQIETNYGKAMAGVASLEFDNIDPLAAFRSQYLNLWELNPRRQVVRGDALASEDQWTALATDAPFAPPDSAALESHFTDGVSLALAWKQATHVAVSVSNHPDLTSAVAALRESGFRGVAMAGASLADDPAMRGVRCKPVKLRGAVAAHDFARLLTEDAVRHDGGEHLTEQVLAVRTVPAVDVPRIVSTGRADAIKAATMAISRARANNSLGKPRVLTASAKT